MIIKMDTDGTIEKTIGSRVFKMSNNANKVMLIGPIAKTSNVLINFKLPDGTMQYGIMQYSGLDVTEDINLWTYAVKNNITEIAGTIEVSIEVRTDTEVLPTAITHITVEDSIPSEIVPGDVDEFLNVATSANVTAVEAKNRNVIQDQEIANRYTKGEAYSSPEVDLLIETVKQSGISIEQLNTLNNLVIKRDGSTTMASDYAPENSKDVVVKDWLLEQINNLKIGEPAFNALQFEEIEALNMTDVIEQSHRHNHDGRYLRLGDGITCVTMTEYTLNVTVSL